MIGEQVIWTALPKGYDDQGRLVVSVHVAPRLVDDSSGDPHKLGDYPTFVDWPAQLAGLEWQLDFDGQTVPGALLEKADSALWTALFPKGTLTRPHEFTDHATKMIHVFPVRDVLKYVKETYGALAAAGPDLPSIDDPNGPLAAFGPLDGIADAMSLDNIDAMSDSSFLDEYQRAKNKGAAGQSGAAPKPGGPPPVGKVVHESYGGGAGLTASQQSAQSALFEAYRFYHRPGSQRPDFPEDYIEPPPDVPEFDFHEMLSLLADHPVLLRRLGLIVDLVVEVDDPVGSFSAQGVLRVVPSPEWPADPLCPGTRYELDGEWFGARSLAKHRMHRGMLNLTGELWDLFQVDIDGAALQAIGFAGTYGALLDPELRNAAAPSETGAPALRSAGLALARYQRGETLLGDLVDRRAANTAVTTGSSIEFNAEDLVRGYRVDVWDKDAKGGPVWRSLHERVTAHAVTGLPDAVPEIEDEGFIKASAAASEREDHPTPSDDLYLHETVVSWDGWSLAAPRPGKRIVEPGEGDKGSSVADHDPAAGAVLPIVSHVRVKKGTLPRLRIGHTYMLRIRTVDICGNSRPATDEDIEPGDEDLASDDQMYVRFEPVPSPAVLRRHLDTEGESLEHLVIRSDLGMSAAEYLTALEEEGVEHTYAPDSQRHLAPPKGSQQMAETDGQFDLAFGGTTDLVNNELWRALREEGTFLDEEIVDLKSGKRTVKQKPIKLFPDYAQLPKNRGGSIGSKDPAKPAPLGAYAYYPEPTLELPYLPDPLAIGVALFGITVDGDDVFEVAEFPGKWPELTPFRLRLSEPQEEEGDEGLSLTFVDGVLEAKVPQAVVVHGQLSSIFPADRLGHFAMWHWTPELKPKQAADLKQAITDGRHWMFTPFRRVTLTHAVQRPLKVPDMAKVKPARVFGSTFAEFSGPIVNDAKSTGRLDVFAEWTEDVDLLTDKVPLMQATENAVAHSAHAFGFDLAPDENQALVTRPGTPAKPPAIPLPTADRIARHEFGDTKHRQVRYHSVATTRFREYLPRSIAAELGKIQREEPVTHAHHILSTARPAAPDVLYTLPTFGWEKDDAGPVRKHVRRGKAVRVWLNRPWFSSGDGELLAVVLEPAPGFIGPLEVADQVFAIEAAAAKQSGTSHGMGGPVHRATAWKPPSKLVRHLIEVNQPMAMQLSPQTGSPKGGTSSSSKGAAEKLALAQIKALLAPYVTRFGSDPVWKSRVPAVLPTPGDFPRRVSAPGFFTLDEVPPAARVLIAAHNVEFDGVRKLWFCDIELEMGDSYFPFVRLALARYQPNSLDDVHLSRVAMTDFMQVVPDRTAELIETRGGYTITVRGYAGLNVLGDTSQANALLPDIGGFDAEPSPPPSSTTVRVAFERRPPGVPGDLGWERVGHEMVLSATASGPFHVTWSGAIKPPALPDGYDRRIVVTEVETYPRDPLPGDQPHWFSPLDQVRERIVYADAFEL